MTESTTIRPLRRDDFEHVQELEVAAGEAFRAIGMPEVADDDPFTDEALAGYLGTGLAWVVADAAGLPIAYLVAEEVDGNLHVEQVSVHPGSARRGIGRALLEHAARHAREHGMPALTLTTFAEVPWNAPNYERYGFRILTDDEVTPGLVTLRKREADAGLDRWPRVCMRRDV